MGETEIYAEPGRPRTVVLTFLKGLGVHVFLSIYWDHYCIFVQGISSKMSAGHYFGHNSSDCVYQRVFSVVEDFKLAKIII